MRDGSRSTPNDIWDGSRYGMKDARDYEKCLNDKESEINDLAWRMNNGKQDIKRSKMIPTRGGKICECLAYVTS